jgi:phosphatidylglycerol:prolipoprotein diacylglycerol transferase
MDPVALELGPLSIRWYGIFAALGFLAGLLLVNWRAPDKGIPRDKASDLVFWLIVAGIIGARLFYVIQFWSDFRGRLIEVVRIDHGGLVFYGGFIAACLACIIWSRIRGFKLGAVADVLAPVLPAGHALGRIGCFLNGCCFGKPWKGFGGVTYPATGNAVLAVQRELGVVSRQATECAAVLPIQLLAALANVVLVALLLIVERKLKRRGQLFALYVTLYALTRFSLEFGRGDYLARLGPFTPAQVICLILFPVGLAAMLLLARRQTESE